MGHVGLTVLVRSGHLAAAAGKRLERAYGSAHVQAAHLHWALSASNCDYFEVQWPKQWLDFGLTNPLEPDDEGFMHAPQGPGLGVDIDWDAIDDHTVDPVTVS